MIIYLEGEKGGIRTAYNETEAAAHEKDGYVRIDIKKRVGTAKKPRKNKQAKSDDQSGTL